MKWPSELPQLVVGTGSIDSTAGALLAVGVMSPHAGVFFDTLGYNLDAPDFGPGGAMTNEGHLPVPLYVKLRA